MLPALGWRRSKTSRFSMRPWTREQLTQTLLEFGAVPRQAAGDAAHIALAVTNGVDYLVTWNFRHIANAAMRARIEYVCRRAGYEPPIICTPNDFWRPIMKTIQSDSIIDEVHAARDEYAARFDHDVEAIFRDIRAIQEASQRDYVRHSARRIVAGDSHSPTQ